MSRLNVGVVVLLLMVTFTRQGSAQDIHCSRDIDCDNTFNEDSVRDCCVQESVQSVIPAGDEVCRLCYVYGWVEDIAPDNDSASPQSVITADEGETIILHIFHTKNSRSPPGGFGFNIEAGGNATLNEDYTLPGTSFTFFREPTPVSITLLNDGVAGEGLETITLTLIQVFGPGHDSIILGYNTAVIHIRDINAVTLSLPSMTTSPSPQVHNINGYTTVLVSSLPSSPSTEVHSRYTTVLVSSLSSTTSSPSPQVNSGNTAVFVSLFPSKPPSMEEHSKDATLHTYIGLCVAAVVLIVAAVIAISLIVCLKKRQKMVNVADNVTVAYCKSKSGMELSENDYGTTTFKGKENSYECVSTIVKNDIDITISANEAYATRPCV